MSEKQTMLGLQRLFAGKRYSIHGEGPDGRSVDDQVFALSEEDALEQAKQIYADDVQNGMTFCAEVSARRKRNVFQPPEERVVPDDREEEISSPAMGQ